MFERHRGAWRRPVTALAGLGLVAGTLMMASPAAQAAAPSAASTAAPAVAQTYSIEIPCTPGGANYGIPSIGAEETLDVRVGDTVNILFKGAGCAGESRYFRGNRANFMTTPDWGPSGDLIPSGTTISMRVVDDVADADLGMGTSLYITTSNTRKLNPGFYLRVLPDPVGPDDPSAKACKPTTDTVRGLVTVIFASVGTCTWSVPQDVDVVDVVAVGGGGGGSGGFTDFSRLLFSGAGGGGGHVSVRTDVPVSGSTSVTVGSGGLGGAVGGMGGQPGQQSKFGDVTASGGGAAAPLNPSTGQTTGGNSGHSVLGQAQFFTGGATVTLANRYPINGPGGGAGAGANGGDGQPNPQSPNDYLFPGAGGNGLMPVEGLFAGNRSYYGGGGAGSAQVGGQWTPGGAGGGSGGCRYNDTPCPGWPNTGGGGGGGSSVASPSAGFRQWRGGDGGSGVVVVRYVIVPRISPKSQVVIGDEGLPIDPSLPFVASNLDGKITYSVSEGKLPAGLKIDPSTGVISGTPSAAQEATAITIRATDASGKASEASVVIAINEAGAAEVAPYWQEAEGSVGVPITPTEALVPSNVRGTVTSVNDPNPDEEYNQPLPDGLTLDPTTGVISGTPTGDVGTTFVTVSAVGSDGGVAKAIIGFRIVSPLPSAPTTVEAVASDEAAIVTWEEPLYAGAFPVQKYRVRSYPGGRTCEVAAPTMNCAMTGLENGTEYTFTVQAWNQLGGGPESGRSNPVTPRGDAVEYPPSEPLEVEAEVADEAAVVTWEEPEFEGSADIEEYIVTAEPGGETCEATAPTTTCTVTDLDNDVEYVFQVQAVSDDGISVASEESEPVVPDADAPPTLTLDQGVRAVDSRHDRMRTTGVSTGIEPGTKLTAWIQYSDRDGLGVGVASIIVQEDGTFRWTRLIRKKVGFIAYVSYADTTSNVVVWERFR